MKALLVIAVVVALAFLGWRLATSGDGGHEPQIPTEAHESNSPASYEDAAEVFKQAFWKRPSAGDRILHAERREWEGEDGILQWQWCIEVEPSPALLKYLRDDNAFGLSTGAKIEWEAPADWFPESADELAVMQSVDGSMTLLFSQSGDKLYGIGSGGGFRPGAPTPPKPETAQTESAGRIPRTPPPNPQR
ncbi:MAG: hypothetical protein ACSHYA_13210 [Opitutaceae bacterium]